MFDQRIGPPGPHSGPSSWFRHAIRLAGGLLLAFAMQAHAAVAPGDKFDFNWTGTNPLGDPVSGTAQLTLGSALTATTFSLSSFDVFQNGGGFCGPCASLTEVLTGVSFNAPTFDLLGQITGDYLGQTNNFLHTFVLTLTDISSGSRTWIFTDTNTVQGGIATSQGTYAPLVPSTVDEPAVTFLVGLGLLALSILRRRSSATPPLTRERA